MERSSAMEGQRICPVTLEGITLKDRVGVYFSSGALWRASNVQRCSTSARTGERVSGDSSSLHSVGWQKCVSIPWAQQELWKLVNTETGLPPRSMWPDEESVS